MTIIKGYCYNGSLRVAFSAFFVWNTEVPSTIGLMSQSSTNAGSTDTNFQFETMLPTSYSPAPSGTTGTDAKITLWACYPEGLYFINRSGQGNVVFTVYHLM